MSFEVRAGEIFGLIGPDGAGKTTIIRTIVTLLDLDEGEVFFQGKNVAEFTSYIRAHIGYMPQRFSLYQDLTVEENLRFFGDLFNVTKDTQQRRRERLYDFSKLGPFKKRRAHALSGGMKQKLALSCMLMHEPEVVVLDEPTFGVDPVSRSEFWDILKHLAAEGTSILVSTAYMDEAQMCDRVGLISEGLILGLDEPLNLIHRFTEPLYIIRTDSTNETYGQLLKTQFKEQIELFGGGVHFSDTRNIGLKELKNKLRNEQVDFVSISKIQPDLEDLFLKLMKGTKVPS